MTQLSDLVGKVDGETLSAIADTLDHLSSNRLETEYFLTPDMDPDTGSPYTWQEDFHNNHSFGRMLMCPNQSGKTRPGSAEVAIHTTGLYPPWWQGRRYEGPTDWVVGATTNETSRDIMQAALLGPKRRWGTGWIPHDRLVMKTETGEPAKRQCGIDNVVDNVDVRHTSGRSSNIRFKTYSQGRSAWEGFQVHGALIDEEPKPEDANVVPELLTRLVAAKPFGMFMVTRTPMYGTTDLVRMFLEPKPDSGLWYRNITWDDAPHLTEEMKARLRSAYPDHEIDARTKGLPMMGEGLIYPVGDEDLYWEPPDRGLPPWWARIVGLDFGWSHPTAAVWMAWDRDADVVYIYDCMRESFKEPVYHAAAIKSRGDWIPVAWPHDGLNASPTGGKPLMRQYLKHGVKMLGMSARYDNKTGGRQDTEPMTQVMLERMKSGALKVARHLSPWFEEKRMYHRRSGKIVRENDDLLSATHYGLMMLRCARTQRRPIMEKGRKDYDPLGMYRR